MPKLDPVELYVLGDALHMELSVSADDTIDGTIKMPVDCVEVGLRFELSLNIESSRVDWKGAKPGKVGLLLRGEGDLGMFVLHDIDGTKEVHIAILDTSLIKDMKSAKKTLRLTNYMEDRKQVPLLDLYWKSLHEGRVATYYRGEYAKDWKPTSGLLDKQAAAA